MILGAFLGLSVASCADQNFDWEDAKSQNPEYVFRSNFEKLVGKIDPNQTWDFSKGGYQTRAQVINGKTPTITADGDTVYVDALLGENVDQINRGNLQNQKLPNMLSTEGSANNSLSTLKPFVLQSNGKFWVCPIWRGVCDQTYTFQIIGQNPFTGKRTIFEQTFNTVMEAATSGSDGRDITKKIEKSDAHGNNTGWAVDFLPGTIITFALKSADGTISTLNLEATSKFDPNNDFAGKYDNIVFMDDSKGDKDFNDLVFLIQNKGNAPTPITKDETISKTASKRYMVEDLGSTAATDIDFNDIVIDFENTTNTSITTKTIGGYTESVINIEKTQQAIVRAMGGTLDFEFLVGGTPIFKKSEHLSDFGGIEVTTMYNTTAGEIDYDAEYEIDLAEFGNPWDAETNNVSFRVWRSESSTSHSVPGTVNNEFPEPPFSEFAFPTPGSVPYIIAFDTDKKWRKERQKICSHFLYEDLDGSDECETCGADDTDYKVEGE